MKDYAAMSDFEINEAVGKFVYLPHLCVSNGVCLYAKDDIWTEFDPCNNPADAWPIITAAGISLIKCAVDSGCWSAEVITDIDEVTDKLFQCQSSFDYQDANPFRAAMVVFLMMKDGE